MDDASEWGGARSERRREKNSCVGSRFVQNCGECVRDFLMYFLLVFSTFDLFSVNVPPLHVHAAFFNAGRFDLHSITNRPSHIASTLNSLFFFFFFFFFFFAIQFTFCAAVNSCGHKDRPSPFSDHFCSLAASDHERRLRSMTSGFEFIEVALIC
ncbi:hypothetical protein CAOG_009563 [Capsaspora owczarzaki ATCC 30864]|uniref:Transmembrane protein n=1 Tax=Capsaspora owczarzaki (strain ATCC 30864) TaxID=595528 RepID=A0A0D2WLH6_CAPO3|nr:hypothetical protein CAOG_009563 [Capsaspora owczarzaki ATCC 30864]